MELMEPSLFRYSRGEVSTLDLPYDTRSVMHYTSRAFSRNGRATITASARGGVTERSLSHIFIKKNENIRTSNAIR